MRVYVRYKEKLTALMLMRQTFECVDVDERRREEKKRDIELTEKSNLSWNLSRFA